MNRAAVFLDRDGTVIELVHHLTQPEQVRLIDGAADAIRALQALDYACVVVTNQSVVGRGMLTEQGLLEVHRRMDQLLADRGAKLDGLYYCPVAPRQDVVDRSTVEHPERKPGPGMLLRASREMLLDLGRCWMVGDMLSDTHAGRNAGCRGTVLVRTGAGQTVAADDPSIDFVANNLLDAARLIARHHVSNEPTQRKTLRERTVV